MNRKELYTWLLYKSKLVLINKEGKSIPNVENGRAMSMLSTITKAFEVVIINNLEKYIWTVFLSENQRGLHMERALFIISTTYLSLVQK